MNGNSLSDRRSARIGNGTRQEYGPGQIMQKNRVLQEKGEGRTMSGTKTQAACRMIGETRSLNRTNIRARSRPAQKGKIHVGI